MRKFITRIALVLFPPSDEERTVINLTEVAVRALYAPHRVASSLALSSFTDARIRALVHEAKFHRSERAFFLLSLLPLAYLTEHPGAFDVIVPIPLSTRRLRERGYNQVAEVLSARNLSIPIGTNVLTRTRHTKPQTELGRTERVKNIAGAFSVTRPEIVGGKRILLVDDVTTTGATLAAARDALAAASPASITCIAFTH